MMETESNVFILEQVPYSRIAARRGEEVKINGFVQVNGVTSGIRFVYYLIDSVIYYLLSTLLSGILALIIPYLFNFNDMNQSNSLAIVIIYLISFLFSWSILFMYYFILERTIDATIGKLIFGYVVVDKYGNKPSGRQIAIRSVSRLVPFEAFSCFSWKGWHDRWSDTMVISKKELADLKTLWQSSQL
jgi:uncharacterized RDD family membrane protein YckC